MIDPQTAHLVAVARDRYANGDYPGAEEPLRAVLERHDDFADVHNMLGVVEYSAGRFKEAQAHFERALAINPRFTEAALHLSVCYNDMGRYGDAREVYARATGAVGPPEDAAAAQLDRIVHARIANLHAQLGDSYMAIGLLERAARELAAAIEMAPSFPDLRLKLADCLRDMGRREDALDKLLSLRHDEPTYLPARLHLGLTYWSLGRLDEARTEWHAVLDAEPDNRMAQFYLAATV